jgi:hypothetical protein
MSAVFWVGAMLLTTAVFGLLIAAWYGLRGRGRNRSDGR